MPDDLPDKLRARLDTIDLSDDLPHHPYCAALSDVREFRNDLCDCDWPQRVLAWCAAMREILELHAPQVRPVPRIGNRMIMSEPECQSCADWDEADYDGPPCVKAPCPTLRRIARALGEPVTIVPHTS